MDSNSDSTPETPKQTKKEKRSSAGSPNRDRVEELKGEGVVPTRKSSSLSRNKHELNNNKRSTVAVSGNEIQELQREIHAVTARASFSVSQDRSREMDKDKVAKKKVSNAPPKKKSPRIPKKRDEPEEQKGKSKDKDLTKVTDYKGMEEFLEILDQWQKFAQGEPIEGIPNVKADARTFSDQAKKALQKFVTANILKSSELNTAETAAAVSQFLSEESLKIQTQLRSSIQAFHSTESLGQLLHQFFQNFIKFYHQIGSDFHFWNSGTENLEGLGWTLEEETEIYRSFPVRGEFPPTEYRTGNYDETESKSLPDFARSAHERLHALPALLRRFEGELAFRANAVNIPDANTHTLLNKTKSSGTDLQSTLFTHKAEELSKIYGTHFRGGNLFSATRGALCFLLHAQATLDLLATTSLHFKSLLTPFRPSEKRHVLDLLLNIPLISVHQSNTPHIVPNELAFIRKFSSLLNYDDGKTLADVFRALEQRTLLRTHPRTDLAHTLVAMFFDAPFRHFQAEFENQVRTLQMCRPPFLASSLHFAPLFLHQDSEYIQEYFARNSSSEYSQSFLQWSARPMRKENAELLDIVGKSGSCGTVLSKVGSNIFSASLPQHKYASDNAALFHQLGEATKHLVEVAHQLDNVGHIEKTQLLTSLLRQSVGPDIVSSIQSSSDLSDFEEKSINYVNRRNISSGIYEMLRSTLHTIQSYAYPFYQQDTTFHTEEVTDRFVSLLLGYPHGYSRVERPKEKFFLDLDYIVPFLYRYRSAIVDPGKHKTPVLGMEYEFFKSPLVHVMFRTALRGFAPAKSESRGTQKQGKVLNQLSQGPDQPPQEDSPSETITIITQLYNLWEESKVDPRAIYELNVFLIKLLAPVRYDQEQLKEIVKAQVESCESTALFLRNCERGFSAYRAFSTKYEAVLHSDAPLPDNLCPVLDSHGIPFHDDAQVPAQII